MRFVLWILAFLLMCSPFVFAEKMSAKSDSTNRNLSLFKNSNSSTAQSAKEQRIKISGDIAVRYKNQDYFDYKLNDSNAFAFRIRLNAQAKLSKKSDFNARFVSKPPSKENWALITWNTFLSPKNNLADERFVLGDILDRYFYTYHFNDNLSCSIGKMPLRADPDEIIVAESFFSYTGVEFVSNFNLFKSSHELSLGYGNFYTGANMPGLEAWGNKDASDFRDVNVYAASLSSEIKRFNYEIGLVGFNNSRTGKRLLSYSYLNTGYRFSSKADLSFEIGDNFADNDGTFTSSVFTYGIKNLKNPGETNLSVQFVDAHKNAVFNRYSILEGFTGYNNNNPQTAWVFKLNRALGKDTQIMLQHMSLRDKIAPRNTNDSSMWRLDFTKKF